MVEITLKFTDEQAAAMVDAIRHEAEALARNPDVQAKLPEGITVEDVKGWPVKRQAKLVIYAKLMQVRQLHERRLAAVQAGDAAGDAARDSSPMDVTND